MRFVLPHRFIQALKLTLFVVLTTLFFTFVKLDTVINFIREINAQLFQGEPAPEQKEDAPDPKAAVKEIKLADVYYPAEYIKKSDRATPAWAHTAPPADQGYVVVQQQYKPRAVRHDAAAVVNADKKAFATRRQAAEQGDAGAQVDMGDAYRDGAASSRTTGRPPNGTARRRSRATRRRGII